MLRCLLDTGSSGGPKNFMMYESFVWSMESACYIVVRSSYVQTKSLEYTFSTILIFYRDLLVSLVYCNLWMTKRWGKYLTDIDVYCQNHLPVCSLIIRRHILDAKS